MLFQITQICFSGSGYAMLHSLMRIMTENCQNDAKTAAIMILSYFYVGPVRKVLLQAYRDRCCSLVKLAYIFLLFRPT